MTKVLLADSSVTIQKVADLVLSDKGFEVKAVNTGGEALAAVASFKPDIVLADISLPDINGYELAERMRAGQERGQVPVILLAGAFDPVDEERMRTVGAVDSLTKPFEADDILGKVNAALQVEPATEVEVEAETEEILDVAEEEAVAEVAVAEAAEDLAALAEDVESAVEAEAADVAEVPEVEVEAEVEAEAVVEAEPALPAEETGFETAAQAAPAADVARAVKAAVAEAVGGMDLKGEVVDTIARGVKDSVEKILWEVAPELTEKLLKEALSESLGSLKREIENVIWETVPELAESIIKDEITRIRSQG